VDYSQVFGKRQVAPLEELPMTRDTVFLIASMSKLVTTVAALQLVERGLVGLDDDVSARLPALARQDVLRGFAPDGTPQTEPRAGPITLRQLLTHSYGGAYDGIAGAPLLPRWREIHGRALPEGGRLPATIDDAFGVPLIAQPGAGWSYGTGLDWAGQLVEKLAGVPLEEHMRQHIFAPLGLRDITFWPDKRAADDADFQRRRAQMTFRDAETGRASQTRKPFNMSEGLEEAAGGQGLFATMADYIEILHSLLTDDGRLLRSETVASMFTPQLSPPSKAALLEDIKNPAWMVGHFPDTAEYDWGLGGVLIDGDKHPFRRRGALLWSGAPNLAWVSVALLAVLKAVYKKRGTCH
jgi:CubicO group peptidase (beta-lactamase class C family)